MEIKNIEKFFLDTILIISMGGVSLVLVSNVLLYPKDTLSINISAVILMACVLAFLIRTKYPTFSVLLVTSVALATMCYQRLTVPNTTTTLSVVLIVGFMYSVMLKGKMMWVMHGVAFVIINTIFVFHLPDAVTAAITYSTLYFILTFASGVLKGSYDRIHQDLLKRNAELHDKGNEIAAQNEELLQIQDNLSDLNKNLEQAVYERTAKIQKQNEILIKYSYTNAHHLRGPVARLLGLASIYKLDSTSDPNFFIEKMIVQAHEIDVVIKQINVDLESGYLEHPGDSLTLGLDGIAMKSNGQKIEQR